MNRPSRAGDAAVYHLVFAVFCLPFAIGYLLTAGKIDRVSLPISWRALINWFDLADAVICLLFAVYWLLFTKLRKDS
jgi:hypothetical protein